MMPDHLVNENALSVRRTRFRDIAGCISWNGRAGSDVVKAYMDRILPQACKDANSTHTFRDLSRAEITEMHSRNIGSFPERSRHKNKRGDSPMSDVEDKPIMIKDEGTAFDDGNFNNLFELSKAEEMNADETKEAPEGKEEAIEGAEIRPGWLRFEEMPVELWNAVVTTELFPLLYATSIIVFEDASTLPRQRLVHHLLQPTRREYAIRTGSNPSATDPNTSYFSQWCELQMALVEQWNANKTPPTLVDVIEISQDQIVWKFYTSQR